MSKKDGMTDKPSIDISDKDIYAAMKDIPGYLDITPNDLKEVYRHAYGHAVERLTRSLKAKDIMTQNVVSVSPETPLSEVARVMAKHEITGMPVVDNKKIVGIITEEDFLALLGIRNARTLMDVLVEYMAGKGCTTASIADKTAREIMTSPVITVNDDTLLGDIAGIFTSKGIKRVPVLDKAGSLVGIVSRHDIVKASFGGLHGVL